MNNNLKFIAGLITATLFSYSLLSHSNDASPTHCKSGETVVLNVEMYKPVDERLVNTGKILSLCADKNNEPFGKFVYRYGAIGKVEMEQTATASDKFGLSQQSDASAHVGLISISFRKGKYIYEVSEGLGMARSGITLAVYESGKRVLTLISSASAYKSDMTRINYEKASSPVFKLVKPVAPW